MLAALGLLLSCRSLFTTIKHGVLIVKLLAACLLQGSEAGEDPGWGEMPRHSTDLSEEKRRRLMRQ